jgi:uncharacterized delta-60 repeat protein
MNITGLVRRLAEFLLLLGAGVCLAAPGDIDTGFGSGGSIPANGPLLTMPDGRLVVGRRITEGFEVVAYDPTGRQRDPGFGTAGRTFVNLPATAYFGAPAARAADGRLLFSGERTLADGSKVRTILRLTANGVPDPTFGVRADGSADLPDLMAIVGLLGLQDGRTLVLEWQGTCASDGIGISCEGPLVVWGLLANGSVDTSFGSNGRTAIPDSLSAGDWPSILGVRPDGSILVGDNTYGPSLAVLTPSGAIDTTFDATTAKTSETWWHRGAMLPDGGLLLVGTAGNGTNYEPWNHEPLDTRLLKLRPDGRVDTGFGNGSGIVTLNLSAAASTRTDVEESWPEIALSPDGSQVYLQTVIQANSRNDYFCLAVARVSIAGALDATFGQRGLTCVTRNYHLWFLDRLAIQASGEPLLVLSDTWGEGPYPPAVYRLRTDNSPSPGVISILAVSSVDEGIGTLAVKVARTAGKNGAVSIAYSTDAWTATAGDDYVSASGRLDWADGDDSERTIDIIIRKDAIQEGENESFILRLVLQAGEPLLLGSPFVVNIRDNYSPALPPPTPPPAAPITVGGTGGGGGAIQFPALLFLSGLGARAVRRRRHCRH